VKTESTDDRPVRARQPAAATAEMLEIVPPQLRERGASTGTVDDEDEPEDEHDGENEASVRASRDGTEAQ
jgi:hypothetical protein